MKKIVIVRHAKSSWEHNVSDHERPLNKRGLDDANLISKVLKGDDIALDLVLSSDANRALTTAKIFLKNLNIKEHIFHLNHDLYDFSGNDFIRVVKNCDSKVNNLMLFGHNHAITAFVNSYGDIFIDNVPTCGVVIIEFDISSWKDLKKGKTLKTTFPRNLK
ncbi:SixA phosphatase family protein [Litoribaculum gwangyangense]|uniref:Histidine phosphatase family protein n=1 Tax=Litoribaculum gwangyangense TaxID=1130722 RepID=A0ABP9CII5_9FLAO